MIKREISIHLQDFPDLNFIKDNSGLVDDMDLVRAVCSCALSIRDNKNLRVRLPLNKLTVIGKNAAKILEFKSIIAEEVNVKNIEIEENLADKADLKLAVNFKKVGATLGPKIKEIMSATKSGDWKKVSENEVGIAGITLKDDDFTLKLSPKKYDEKILAIQALNDNSHLVVLDVVITKELQNEGIARDIIRLIQQARKDAGLDVSDRIDLIIGCKNPEIGEVTSNFGDYIKEQVLAKSLAFNGDIAGEKDRAKFYTTGKTDLDEIQIAINL